MWGGNEYLQYNPTSIRFIYLVPNSFAHEEGGDVERQDVLEEKLVDVLHGLHLLSFHFETSLQQEVYTATELVLRENDREREGKSTIMYERIWIQVNLFQN